MGTAIDGVFSSSDRGDFMNSAESFSLSSPSQTRDFDEFVRRGIESPVGNLPRAAVGVVEYHCVDFLGCYNS